MQSTRERILAYLNDHLPSSTEEISRYLEMTPANIRYHLEILEEEGYVGVTGKRSPGGAGRPILLYSLTSFSLGDNLVPLLEGFLGLVNESESPDQLLNEVAENLIRGKLDGKKNRVGRFNQGVELLNSLHYYASWEARPQGPRVELRHCPYQNLAQTYPILCQLDQLLVQRIFDTDLSLTQRRTFGINPFSPCIFQAE
jgi:predicted ArsR family transcriptional regulator